MPTSPSGSGLGELLLVPGLEGAELSLVVARAIGIHQGAPATLAFGIQLDRTLQMGARRLRLADRQIRKAEQVMRLDGFVIERQRTLAGLLGLGQIAAAIAQCALSRVRSRSIGKGLAKRLDRGS